MGDWITRSLTLLKIGGLLLIIVMGIALCQTSPSFQLTLLEQDQRSDFFQGFALALIGVSFSFADIQYATFLAAESHNAARSVAWAMTLGVLLVIMLYMFTNYAYLKLLPVYAMTLSEVPASDALKTASPMLGAFIPLVIMISAAGTIASFTLAAPRMYQSMAEDGLFFPLFMKKYTKFNTPIYSIAIQSAWAAIWVLFWGTFAGVITHLVITNLVFMVMAAGAVFILRKRSDDPPLFRTPGYPVVPAIYIAISVYIILATFISSPLSLAVFTVFVVIGWLIYRYAEGIYSGAYVKNTTN